MGTNPEAGPGALPRPRGRSWSAREHATDRIEPISGRRMATPLSCSFVALRAAPSVLSSWPTHPISLEHRQESSARITRSGYSRRFPDHLPSRQTRASGFAPSRRAHPFPLPPRPGLTFRVLRKCSGGLLRPSEALNTASRTSAHTTLSALSRIWRTSGISR